MAIPIKFDDDKIDHVPKTYFDLLLNSGCITAFRRSDGEWVDIKTGRLRGHSTKDTYRGPERRESSAVFRRMIDIEPDLPKSSQQA